MMLEKATYLPFLITVTVRLTSFSLQLTWEIYKSSFLFFVNGTLARNICQTLAVLFKVENMKISPDVSEIDHFMILSVASLLAKSRGALRGR